IVMAAMSVSLADNGNITDAYRQFYIERAKGGAGLILMTFMVHYYHKLWNDKKERLMMPLVWGDEYVPPLRDLMKSMHAAGAKMGAQLAAFPDYQRDKNSPPEIVGPSPIAVPGRPKDIMREMTIADIEELIYNYGQAARRCREAGFDCVQFHCVAGESTLSLFLSKATNLRKDKYGGDVEGRLRIITECLEAAKREAGADYTYMIRFSGDEFVQGGQTLEDSKVIAPILVKAGFQCIDAATGRFDSTVPFVQASVPRGAFVYLAEEIKKVVKVPVIGGCRVNDPILANQIVEQGRADLVWMGRPLIADPELPNKALAGRVEDVCPCIACNNCLENIVVDGVGLSCSVNARAGRELEMIIKPAAKPKKVLVIGAGPAGMEAARLASARGHKVTVWEKSDHTGGQLTLACCPPHKEELLNYNSYLTRQLGKCGAKLVLNKDATAQAVQAEKPDVVIVAAGGVPIVPPFPGINGKNVVQATDVLTGAKQVGNKVIIVGGGMVGCETAELLAEQGKKDITIVEMLPRIGQDIGATTRWVVLGRLRKAGVKVETKAKVMEITATGLKADREGQALTIDADSVVIAVGMKANDAVAKALQGTAPEVYTIGDCVRPQKIKGANSTAAEVAIKI
ncbi:MAG: NAD(P)/FAD-dependent oxidoreductase, partial [bacterium]|nr:NAD(P)/FAD-dependent oxidoreductase [bacterium]